MTTVSFLLDLAVGRIDARYDVGRSALEYNELISHRRDGRRHLDGINTDPDYRDCLAGEVH